MGHLYNPIVDKKNETTRRIYKASLDGYSVTSRVRSSSDSGAFNLSCQVCKVEIDCFQTPRESQIKNAKVELGEDDEKLEHMEGLLQTWIDSLDYFPKNYDKRMMRNFLRFSKYNLERTKQKLEMYYMMKNAYAELLCNRNPHSNEMASVADSTNQAVLPNFTETGERIFVMRLKNSDVAAFNIQLSMKYFFMFYDLLLTVDYPISSEILILDATGFAPAHFTEFMSSTFRHAMKILIKGYSVRLKEIHIVNSPSMVEKMLAMMKSILHEKMFKRIQIHTSTDELLERFSEKLMPKEYGGCLKSIDDYSQDIYKMMKDNVEWFNSQESAKITEDVPKYRDTFKDLKDQLGLHGSFRKITID